MRGVLGLIAAAGVASGASAQVFEQPPDYAGNLGNGYFSDGEAGYFYEQRMADNFDLGGPVLVDRVVWWGMSEFYVFPDLTNFSDWTIAFYDSGFSELSSQKIAKGDIGITTDAEIFPGYYVYRFDAMVGAVSLDKGWISIGSHNIDPFDDAFAWHVSAKGDNMFAADFFDGGGYQTFTGLGDLAFALYEVPAPGSLALLGLGGLAALRRRR